MGIRVGNNSSHRVQVGTPAAALQERALALPSAWAPLLAVLVRDHAAAIPDAMFAEWLQVHSYHACL